MDEFEEAMANRDTHPDVIWVVTSRSSSWEHVRDEDFSNASIAEEVKRAAELQDGVGWLHFVCGQMVKPWKDVQELSLT